MSLNDGLDVFVDTNDHSRLVIQAKLKPIAGQDRFQPAGFPEIGHVIYDAPRPGHAKEKVCIVDSPASMANHLESVCLMGPHDHTLAQDLAGLPYVRCVTDRTFTVSGNASALNPDTPHDKLITITLTEGHRLASDYFLDGLIDPRWKNDGRNGDTLRDHLGNQFELIEPPHAKSFTPPGSWWSIYKTIFRYDPNSLVHGVLFPRWQIKIPRLLTAHMEAFGAARVGTSGVKFDQLGKTSSGQPIFSVDHETAREIRATFILDLAMLRSYGRSNHGGGEDLGLSKQKKKLLLGLALWKVDRLLSGPFRYRSGCDLSTEKITVSLNGSSSEVESVRAHLDVDMKSLIKACEFDGSPVTDVYYPADRLFKLSSNKDQSTKEGEDAPSKEDS